MSRNKMLVRIGRGIFLIILGIALAAFMLEAFLQVSAAIIRTSRQNQARRALRGRGEITILCLGESTTDGQWPRFLAQALKEAGITKEVRVIDRGVGSTTSYRIVANVPYYIERYNPDIIVAMMGINDEDTYVTRTQGMRLRTVRLFHMIRHHLRASANYRQYAALPVEMPPVPEEIECDSGIPREVTERMEAAFTYFSERNYDAAMNTFVTLLEEHEEHAVFISEQLPFILPWFHFLWEGERFLAFLQNAVRLHDYDVNSNHWLFYYYALMTNNEKILSEVIKGNPWIFVSSMETTTRYFPHLHEKFLEKVLSSQIIRNKTGGLGFNALHYIRRGDFQAADRYFNKITHFICIIYLLKLNKTILSLPILPKRTI